MNITFTVPDDVAQDVIDGICAATNYSATSGLTKAQWAKARVVDYMKRMAAYGRQLELGDTVATAIKNSAIT